MKPDVVIMDIKFEGDDFDGIDAARILTEEKVAPVVLLTAYSQRELVVRAREAGVVGYLVKPFREADLIRRSRWLSPVSASFAPWKSR